MNKRLSSDRSWEEGESSAEQQKRLRTFPKPSVSGYAFWVPSEDVFCSRVEPFIRSMVRATVEDTVSSFMKSRARLSFNQLIGEASRQWQLEFRSKLPDTLYAGSPIKADDNSAVQLVLVDTHSNEIVKHSPLSSIKVQVVVMDGDFCGDGKEDWLEAEFNSNIVRARDGKPDLLKGEVVVKLSNGVGQLGDLSFTDNSSWIRSKKFKLGARALDKSFDIREALTGAFPVKDHRGELYKKHHPPSLDDKVWRLEHIAKDGVFHKKLENNGIHTVEDFRRLLYEDKTILRSILGKGMPNKSWEETVNHAMECCSLNKENLAELCSINWNDIYRLNSPSSRVLDHILPLSDSMAPYGLDICEGPISDLQKEPSDLAGTPNLQSFYSVRRPFSSVDEPLPVAADLAEYNAPLSGVCDLSVSDYEVHDNIMLNEIDCCSFWQPHNPFQIPQYVSQASSSSWVALLTTIKCGGKFLMTKRKGTVPISGC